MPDSGRISCAHDMNLEPKYNDHFGVERLGNIRSNFLLASSPTARVRRETLISILKSQQLQVYKNDSSSIFSSSFFSSSLKSQIAQLCAHSSLIIPSCRNVFCITNPHLTSSRWNVARRLSHLFIQQSLQAVLNRNKLMTMNLLSLLKPVKCRIIILHNHLELIKAKLHEEDGDGMEELKSSCSRR